MNTLDTFEINTRISKRMWKFVSFAAGINSTLEDTQPVSYEDGDPAYRALCRTLAWNAASYEIRQYMLERIHSENVLGLCREREMRNDENRVLR